MKRRPKGATIMRGLGIAMMLIGVLGLIATFLYSATLGWGGLFGCVALILSGVGFFAHG